MWDANGNSSFASAGIWIFYIKGILGVFASFGLRVSSIQTLQLCMSANLQAHLSIEHILK